jgi:membrane protease YdiL (CAAX protease family)
VAAGAGLVLTVLYLLRRDLWANIISHFLTDAVSVLLR